MFRRHQIAMAAVLMLLVACVPQAPPPGLTRIPVGKAVNALEVSDDANVLAWSDTDGVHRLTRGTGTIVNLSPQQAEDVRMSADGGVVAASFGSAQSIKVWVGSNPGDAVIPSSLASAATKDGSTIVFASVDSTPGGDAPGLDLIAYNTATKTYTPFPRPAWLTGTNVIHIGVSGNGTFVIATQAPDAVDCQVQCFPDATLFDITAGTTRTLNGGGSACW